MGVGLLRWGGTMQARGSSAACQYHRTRCRRCRLEALSERRQSMVQRVKAAQKERDNLAGDKEAAEGYLAKERECLGAQSVLAQVLASKAKVRGIGSWLAGCWDLDWRRRPQCPGCCQSRHLSLPSPLQHNVEKIESNVARLEERLGHEKAKFAQYDVVLKEHEARCARGRWWSCVGGCSGGELGGRGVGGQRESTDGRQAACKRRQPASQRACAARPPSPARSYNAVNGEYQAIAAELEAATGEFKEFERKDIKYRCGYSGGCLGWRGQ